MGRHIAVSVAKAIESLTYLVVRPAAPCCTFPTWVKPVLPIDGRVKGGKT